MDRLCSDWRAYQAEMQQLGGGHYKLDSLVGKGSYGLVFKAKDTRTNELVAIKRVHEDILRGTNPLTVRRIWQEILVNSHLHHPNIIYLREILPPQSSNFNTLYMVFDFMEIDLSRVLKNRDEDFSDDHIKWIICQVFRALDYVHNCGIVHRDVTPSNVLLSQECDVKLCDFGLARDNHGCEMTEYVVMRWYRAPELVMEDSDYSAAVDVWACGCIMGQMFYQNKELFCGESKVKQLDAIIKVIGTPSDEDLNAVGCHNARSYVRTRLRDRAPLDFNTMFSKPEGGPLSPEALDLLKRMLVFNPKKRITVPEALAHPYLADTNQWFEENLPALSLPRMVKVEMPTDRDDVHALKRLILDLIPKLANREHPKASKDPVDSPKRGLHEVPRANNASASTTGAPPKSSPLISCTPSMEDMADEDEELFDEYDEVWD